MRSIVDSGVFFCSIFTPPPQKTDLEASILIDEVSRAKDELDRAKMDATMARKEAENALVIARNAQNERDELAQAWAM